MREEKKERNYLRNRNTLFNHFFSMHSLFSLSLSLSTQTESKRGRKLERERTKTHSGFDLMKAFEWKVEKSRSLWKESKERSMEESIAINKSKRGRFRFSIQQHLELNRYQISLFFLLSLYFFSLSSVSSLSLLNISSFMEIIISTFRSFILILLVLM